MLHVIAEHCWFTIRIQRSYLKPSFWDVVDLGGEGWLKISDPCSQLASCSLYSQKASDGNCSLMYWLTWQAALYIALRSKFPDVVMGTKIALGWWNTTSPTLKAVTYYFCCSYFFFLASHSMTSYCDVQHYCCIMCRNGVSSSSPHPRFCVKVVPERCLFNLHWFWGSETFGGKDLEQVVQYLVRIYFCFEVLCLF